MPASAGLPAITAIRQTALAATACIVRIVVNDHRPATAFCLKPFGPIMPRKSAARWNTRAVLAFSWPSNTYVAESEDPPGTVARRSSGLPADSIQQPPHAVFRQHLNKRPVAGYRLSE